MLTHIITRTFAFTSLMGHHNTAIQLRSANYQAFTPQIKHSSATHTPFFHQFRERDSLKESEVWYLGRKARQ